jgi:hypothetical protein
MPEEASEPPDADGFFPAASFAASLPPKPWRRFWNTGMQSAACFTLQFVRVCVFSLQRQYAAALSELLLWSG